MKTKDVIFILLLASIGLSFSSCQTCSRECDEGLTIISSSQELEDAFYWAKDKAYSYVMTGKKGVINQSERSEGEGEYTYIPSYWAGYPFRSAFYIRDYCHQMVGAHLLGLEEENFTMLKAFVATANENRKWYPLWALNFDGSCYELDYHNDSSFVREAPAVFELVEKSYKQYLWTANKELIYDPQLWIFYSKVVTEFVDLHDVKIKNGVAEGDGSGNIFKGVVTYNESYVPLVEAGDGIGAQYQAFNAFKHMLACRGERDRSDIFCTRTTHLKDYFNNNWSGNEQNYIRGYTNSGKALTDFGRENSVFMPLKQITEANGRNKEYLRFCDNEYRKQDPRTLNIEGLTYLPDAFFQYNMIEEGWYWTKKIIHDRTKHHIVELGGINGDYPEVAYTIISNIVENIMGVEPSAPTNSMATISRLPAEIEYLGVNNIPVGKHKVSVKHVGRNKTIINHVEGNSDLTCTIRFYGYYPQIKINGTMFMAKSDELNGEAISYVTITIPKGGEITAEG